MSDMVDAARYGLGGSIGDLFGIPIPPKGPTAMQSPDDRAEFDLDLIITDDVAACRVFYKPASAASQNHSATGSAKRHWDDKKPKRSIGEHYAVGRALIALGEQMVKEADRLVENPSGLLLDTSIFSRAMLDSIYDDMTKARLASPFPYFTKSIGNA